MGKRRLRRSPLGGGEKMKKDSHILQKKRKTVVAGQGTSFIFEGGSCRLGSCVAADCTKEMEVVIP